MKIVFGLGNPGTQYTTTRHNAGYIFVDQLAKKLDAQDWSYVDRFKSDATSAFYNQEKIILVKPKTYMNLSGLAVEKVVNYYKADEDDLLVVYDDIDLPLGKFRLRKGGSPGTHNGARSIKESLETRGIEFRRLRLGIDTETEADYQRDLSSFVLGRMSKDELTILDRVINKGIDATMFMWEQGIDAAMQAYNSK